MIQQTAWQKAFLGGHAPLAVQALHGAWDTLVSTSASFTPQRKEPELTEILCEYLTANSSYYRLTGLWSYENRQGRLVRMPDGLEVHQRKRTDIRYFSDRKDPPLNLIFEFKKLDYRKAKRDSYTGEDGMLRFVTGEYSIGEPVAVMVGILTVASDDCVQRLRVWLNSPEAKNMLSMKSFNGHQTRNPSNFFAVAEFDTEHRRPQGKGPAHGAIVISHIFLGF